MLTCDMKALEIGVKDKLHQQYRKSYVDGMEDIFEKTYRNVQQEPKGSCFLGFQLLKEMHLGEFHARPIENIF